MDTAEPVWVPAEQPPVPDLTSPSGERVPSPSANIKEEEGKMAAGTVIIVLVFVVVVMFLVFRPSFIECYFIESSFVYVFVNFQV